MVSVKGTRVIREEMSVDVDPSSFLNKLLENWMKGINPKFEFGSKGMWYVSDGFDYHKREDLYREDRKMTDEEKHIHEAFVCLFELVK